MELANNNNLFTELTEEETNTLNGGAYCIIRYVRRCYRYGFLIYCRLVAVRYCYY